ncbi:MAG: NYN domain-containing protein [Candidatus Aminicenantes bacterium]|nr:MAG: NYN domain-containing protein [Candidatus Aminicenantes bacterium]
MPYLIDGSNLIGHMPNLELSDPKSKHRLAAQLLIFQKTKRTKIILVFDGPLDPDLFGEKFKRKEFSILWPDLEESADTRIKQWIEKQTDLRHLYVVSSDREIKSFAQRTGAKVLDCEEFHKLLKTALKESKESQAMNKEDITLSPLEVDHWLDIFGESDE